LIKPTGLYVVNLLAKHPALRGLGVGLATARRLYAKHGPQLVDHLSNADISALDDLDSDVAYALCERWQALAMEPAVLRWIDEKSLDTRIASKIVALYGAKAIEAMEANPYVLLPFMAFDKIDVVARLRLGLDQLDPRRLVAAVESVLYDDIQENGNTAMLRQNLTARLRPLVSSSANAAIELALQQPVVFAEGNYIRAFAPAMMECGLETWVHDAIDSRGRQQELMLWCNDNRGIRDVIKTESADEAVQLTVEQEDAVVGAVQGHLQCILGGAGVGKTTVLRMIARVVQAAHGQACFMAISGRAARRIAEALGADLVAQCSVTTIASFLKSVAPTLPADSSPWLIVDEASMLDLQNAYRIVTRTPPNSRVVLVGDPHQLPPVGAGLVFHKLVDGPDIPKTELSFVFRQAEETGIPSIARSVRLGVFPDLKPFSSVGRGVQLQPAAGKDGLLEAIRIRNLMAESGDVQLLTVFRRANGAESVNKIMHAEVPPDRPRLTFPLEVALDEPVIYTRNDADLGLQNGSAGRVVEVTPGQNSIAVLWDDGVVRIITGQNLWNCTLAYGITTHKSQGSQYERVVVFVPRACRILDRTLLYTAVTRAKKQAVIVGDVDVVRNAIENVTNASRRIVLFRATPTIT
jgi:exodeoxyribonuclease V alpha subunit